MLRDERLSWKARGLLAYMLSMPDDWVFYESELVKHSAKDGITSLRSAMKELKHVGYVSKEALKGEDGKIMKWVTYVDEEPIHNTENLQSGKPTIKENHNVDNDTLLISINTNTDIINNNNTNNTAAPLFTSILKCINEQLLESLTMEQKQRLQTYVEQIEDPAVTYECINLTEQETPDWPVPHLFRLLDKAIANQLTLEDVKHDRQQFKQQWEATFRSY